MVITSTSKRNVYSFVLSVDGMLRREALVLLANLC